jgi:hypothetical protein
MAHFFVEGSGTSPTNFVYVKVGRTVQVGVWGANVNGQFLLPSINNPATAVVTSKGTNSADGMIRYIAVKGVSEGNVMLEARLGAGGPVWAFTQVVVGKAVADVSGVAARAVAVAKRELDTGVFEDDNDNRGSRIDEYENLFGLKGQAWCAMFVYFCFHTAATEGGAKNPLPKIALASALYNWAKSNDKLVDQPQAGDVLIVKPGTHVGLVTGSAAGGKVPSIEGNTWSHGTKENHVEGVYAKSHPLDSCFYVRP